MSILITLFSWFLLKLHGLTLTLTLKPLCLFLLIFSILNFDFTILNFGTPLSIWET